MSLVFASLNINMMVITVLIRNQHRAMNAAENIPNVFAL